MAAPEPARAIGVAHLPGIGSAAANVAMDRHRVNVRESLNPGPWGIQRSRRADPGDVTRREAPDPSVATARCGPTAQGASPMRAPADDAQQREGLEVEGKGARRGLTCSRDARTEMTDPARSGVRIAKTVPCGLRPWAPGGEPTCSAQALTSPDPGSGPQSSSRDGSGSPCPGLVARSVLSQIVRPRLRTSIHGPGGLSSRRERSFDRGTRAPHGDVEARRGRSYPRARVRLHHRAGLAADRREASRGAHGYSAHGYPVDLRASG